MSLFENDNDINDSPLSDLNSHTPYLEAAQFKDQFGNINNSLSFFHLNCRSLSANWESFYDLLCNLQSDQFQFDFIGMSEVFRCDRDPRLALPGYHAIITRTRDDDCHGGVGIFIRDHINFKIRDDISIFIPHVVETIFIETVSKLGIKHIIGVIYRPNTQPRADFDIFSTSLFDILDIINNERKHCTLLGDFNVDLLKFGSDTKINNFIDNIFSHGLAPLIFRPTRLTRTSATLLDHIYSNNIHGKSHSGIIVTDVADHFGIFYIMHDKSPKTKQTAKMIRYISDRNILLFKQYLVNTNFTSVTSFACPNEAYLNFIHLFKDAFERAFPLTEAKSNTKYIKQKPWVTTGFLTSSRQKSKLFKRQLNKPTVANILSYKSYLRTFSQLKRALKLKYFNDKLLENKNNMKSTWSILRQAIGIQQNLKTFPQTFSINNETIADRSRIASFFNSHFVNIGKTTSENVQQSTNHFTDFLRNPNPNSMYLEPVLPSEIIEILAKLKPKASYGHDEISTKLIKDSIQYIIEPLTHIINRSFETGIVPTPLKIAKVVPIYKTSAADDIKNYRPISLLPAFSKILEKIMYNRLMSFLNRNNILYEHQYGFRSKHSTTHAIIHLLNKCALANHHNPKQYTMSILCDLSKAFDVISHPILLYKLNYYGIRGTVLQWFDNYLSGRSQFVSIENNKSDIQPISCGVPQGSILGPLLYLVYVNDINMSTNNTILSFADDTSILLSNCDINLLFHNANNAIADVFNWFCANKLSLNPQKTKYMVIRSPHKQPDFSNLFLHINNNKLTQVGSGHKEETTKFLGIYLDEHLTWKSHINYINNKISRALFMINQAKNVLPTSSLKTLYFALIHPYLNYGLLTWGSATQSNLNRTIILQKRAVRIINKKSFKSHTDPLFKSSNILKLPDLYECQVSMFMHDFRLNKLPSSFSNVYQLNSDNQGARPTRQSELFYIERCDSVFASKLPLYNFPKIWNKFSNLHCLSRSMFKTNIQSTMYAKYPDNVKCLNIFCIDCRLNHAQAIV